MLSLRGHQRFQEANKISFELCEKIKLYKNSTKINKY